MTRVTREQGSALVITMLLTVFLMGLVAVALIMVQDASTSTSQTEANAKALDVAEVGFNNFLKASRVKADYNADTGEFSAQFGSAVAGDTTGEYRAFSGKMDDAKYSVKTRSAYQAYKNWRENKTAEPVGFLREVTAAERNNLSQPVFDLLEVTASTEGTVDGKNYVRNVQAVVEMQKNIQVPGAMYLEDGTHTLTGGDWRISGEDHQKDPKTVYPDYCVKMPYAGRLKCVFVTSSAALDSGFWLIDPASGKDKMLIPSNHPTNESLRTSYTTEFAAGQELVCFARIQGTNYGVTSYDHYFVGQIDPWHNKAYGCISMYKLKSGVSIEGKTSAQAEAILTNQSNYVLMKDSTGKDMYKRTDLKASDFNTTEVRWMRMGIEDLKGKKGKYYTVDWDWDDIVCDVYILPTMADSGEETNLTYKVVRDSSSKCKFEGAPIGLGENGQLQTDQFKITLNGTASKVMVTTKAGNQSALNEIGDVVTDTLGFTTRLVKKEGNDYYFAVTSDDMNSTPALSHVLFTFSGTTVKTPAAGSYTATRVNGSLEYIAGTTALYDLCSRPNEYDYLTGRNEYAVPAMYYEGDYTDFGFSQYNVGVLVTANGTGTKLTDQNAVKKGSISVDGVADAYLKSSTTINTVTGTSLADLEVGNNEAYVITHATGNVVIASADNIIGGGVLVVDGNLTIQGKLDWTGVILVKGNLVMDPGFSGKYIFVRGSVMVKGSATISGKVDIWYSYDAVQKTLADLAPQIAVVPVPRQWREVN